MAARSAGLGSIWVAPERRNPARVLAQGACPPAHSGLARCRPCDRSRAESLEGREALREGNKSGSCSAAAGRLLLSMAPLLLTHRSTAGSIQAGPAASVPRAGPHAPTLASGGAPSRRRAADPSPGPPPGPSPGPSRSNTAVAQLALPLPVRPAWATGRCRVHSERPLSVCVRSVATGPGKRRVPCGGPFRLASSTPRSTPPSHWAAEPHAVGLSSSLDSDRWRRPHSA